MSIYQLYGTAAASADSIANLDIQFTGEIVAWQMTAAGASMATADDAFGVECSFLSSSMFASNDARGVICRVQNQIGAAGGQSEVHESLSGLAIPVVAGERVHLHAAVSGGTGTVAAFVLLYVLDSQDPNLRRRR